MRAESRPIQIAVWLTHAEVPCFQFGEADRERLERALPGVTVRVATTEADFLAALPESRVAAVWTFRQEWLRLARRLEWLITPAAGRDYFRIEAPPGLALEYCSFHGELIAETVIGMLLAHCRGIREAEMLRESNLWPRQELAEHMTSLRGSHVAILGFGNIGAWIGRLAKPFGVRLTGIRRQAGRVPQYFEDGDRIAGAGELDEVLRRADYLVLALPATRETDAVIDSRRLSLLPTRAVLVNVGRGNAVDEDALAAALASGRLAAAYLDVFRTEPLPAASPLRRCPNAFLMPHAAAISPRYMELFTRELAAKFRARYGEPPYSGGR